MTREQEINILTNLCGWTDIDYRPELGVASGRAPSRVFASLPAISTDETACFRHVVPAMKTKGWRLKIEENKRWNAIFWQAGMITTGATMWIGESEAVADAICLAAKSYLNAQPKGE